jgi:hypothetical protein
MKHAFNLKQEFAAVLLERPIHKHPAAVQVNATLLRYRQ